MPTITREKLLKKALKETNEYAHRRGADINAVADYLIVLGNWYKGPVAESYPPTPPPPPPGTPGGTP